MALFPPPCFSCVRTPPPIRRTASCRLTIFASSFSAFCLFAFAGERDMGEARGSSFSLRISNCTRRKAFDTRRPSFNDSPGAFEHRPDIGINVATARIECYVVAHGQKLRDDALAAKTDDICHFLEPFAPFAIPPPDARSATIFSPSPNAAKNRVGPEINLPPYALCVGLCQVASKIACKRSCANIQNE
jgi:hypothetical protein